MNELWLTKDTQDMNAILMHNGNTLTMRSSGRGRGLSEQGMKQSTGGSKFRHPLKKHCVCFHAVANVVQFQLQSKPTWQVRYNDRIHNN
jgi:hypothetical protein